MLDEHGATGGESLLAGWFVHEHEPGDTRDVALGDTARARLEHPQQHVEAIAGIIILGLVQPIKTHFRDQRAAIEQFRDAFHKLNIAVVTACIISVQEFHACAIVALHAAAEIDAQISVFINDLHVANKFEQFSEIGDIHVSVVATLSLAHVFPKNIGELLNGYSLFVFHTVYDERDEDFAQPRLETGGDVLALAAVHAECGE